MQMQIRAKEEEAEKEVNHREALSALQTTQLEVVVVSAAELHST